MKFERIHINHFGSVHNRTIEFSDGINVIRETTSQTQTLDDFLRAMHFGMETEGERDGSTDLYTRCYPETGSSTYGGVLEFSREDVTYSIYRNFKRDPQGYTLMDEQAGKQISTTPGGYRETIAGLTPDLYRDTIALPNAGDDREQIRRMQNLCTTGSTGLNLEAAQRQLKLDREELDSQYVPEAETRSQELQKQIRELTQERARLTDSDEFALWEKEHDRMVQEETALQDRRMALQQAIANEEEYLERHARETGASLQDAENSCLRLLSRREKLLKDYPDPGAGPLGNLWPLLTIGSGLLGVGALIFGILSLTRGNMVPGIAGILVLAVMAGIFCYSLPRFRAQMAFRYVDRSLRELYRQMLPESPSHIDQKSLQEFLDLMTDLKNRRRHLQKCRKELESADSRLTQLQEKIDRMTVGLDNKKNDFLHRTQVDEQLGRCEAELEGLDDLLRRNHQIRSDLAALELAADALTEVVEKSLREFRRCLQGLGSQIIQELSSDRWQGVSLSEDHRPGLLRGEQRVEPEDLSTEDRNLLALSLRIAAIGCRWPQEPIPMLLRSRELGADNGQLLATLSWLHRYYPGQIFLFTENDSLETRLTAQGIPFHKNQI